MRNRLVLLAPALAALLTVAASAQTPHPDLTLRGTVTDAQANHYLQVPFTVPADIERITVTFSYTGKEDHATLDLGVKDPVRFRGWSGGNKSTFTIGLSDATPSYLPGPIPAGRWKLILGVPNIRQGVRSEYEAKIHLSHAGDKPETPE